MFAKRLTKLSLIAPATVFIALLIGCGPSADEPDCKRNDVVCVGLVTDVGAIDDKS